MTPGFYSLSAHIDKARRDLKWDHQASIYILAFFFFLVSYRNKKRTEERRWHISGTKWGPQVMLLRNSWKDSERKFFRGAVPRIWDRTSWRVLMPFWRVVILCHSRVHYSVSQTWRVTLPYVKVLYLLEPQVYLKFYKSDPIPWHTIIAPAKSLPKIRCLLWIEYYSVHLILKKAVNLQNDPF